MRISGKGKLDSEWGNGPRYKQAELDALNFIKLQPLWKDMTCAVGSSSSRTDGLWIKGESLKFLTEVKSRDTFGKNSSLEFTWDNLLNKYQGKYLISQGKSGIVGSPSGLGGGFGFGSGLLQSKPLAFNIKF